MGAPVFAGKSLSPEGAPTGGMGAGEAMSFSRGILLWRLFALFGGKKAYLAKPGRPGAKRKRNGSSGQDQVIRVPLGTGVKNAETGQPLAEVATPFQRVLLAKGGSGGLGNVHFKSSTNRTPRSFTKGEPGVELALHLEWKLFADFALIGLPNAGKSTCLSVLSAATPRIGAYPFTTLGPNLGVVSLGENSFCTVADTPGLIERASQGRGAGISFLKSMEKTRMFVHLVDVSGESPFEHYRVVREELDRASASLSRKREIICLAKADTLSQEKLKRCVTQFEEKLGGRRVLPLSSTAGKNLVSLKNPDAFGSRLPGEASMTKAPQSFLPQDLARAAARSLGELKGKDLKIFHLKETSDICSWHIVGSGRSSLQVKALANRVLLDFKSWGMGNLSREGMEALEWVLLDAKIVVVHIFLEQVRQRYGLEELWANAKTLSVPCESYFPLPQGEDLRLEDFL